MPRSTLIGLFEYTYVLLKGDWSVGHVVPLEWWTIESELPRLDFPNYRESELSRVRISEVSLYMEKLISDF